MNAITVLEDTQNERETSEPSSSDTDEQQNQTLYRTIPRDRDHGDEVLQAVACWAA